MASKDLKLVEPGSGSAAARSLELLNQAMREEAARRKIRDAWRGIDSTLGAMTQVASQGEKENASPMYAHWAFTVLNNLLEHVQKEIYVLYLETWENWAPKVDMPAGPEEVP